MSIRGIIPALYTAYDGEGQLDPRRQAALVERLVSQGVHGLFAGGSTGEFPLLGPEERERLLCSVLEAARGRVPVIAHAGAADRRLAVRLARHAAREGAQAVACTPPYYYRHREEEILEHWQAVAAAAQPLAFYAYHIPELTGAQVTPRLLEGLLTVPGFAGLKWSDPDLHGLARACRILGARADVLSGKDEVLLAALTLGARGGVGSTYNFLASWFVELWNAHGRGDLEAARGLQDRAGRVIDVLLRWDGALSSGKEVLRWAGLDCGDPRAPLRRYRGPERDALLRELVEAGLR